MSAKVSLGSFIVMRSFFSKEDAYLRFCPNLFAAMPELLEIIMLNRVIKFYKIENSARRFVEIVYHFLLLF